MVSLAPAPAPEGVKKSHESTEWMGAPKVIKRRPAKAASVGMASFDDFAKLDLRVAKIMDVQPVEGSEKLYQLKIKLNGEERTLVAGIAQHYAPDELLGKRIVIVANLEPRKVKGIESQGMLLAAVNDDQSMISLVCPDNEDVPAGAKVT